MQDALEAEFQEVVLTLPDGFEAEFQKIRVSLQTSENKSDDHLVCNSYKNAAAFYQQHWLDVFNEPDFLEQKNLFWNTIEKSLSIGQNSQENVERFSYYLDQFLIPGFHSLISISIGTENSALSTKYLITDFLTQNRLITLQDLLETNLTELQKLDTEDDNANPLLLKLTSLLDRLKKTWASEKQAQASKSLYWSAAQALPKTPPTPKKILTTDQQEPSNKHIDSILQEGEPDTDPYLEHAEEADIDTILNHITALEAIVNSKTTQSKNTSSKKEALSKYLFNQKSRFWNLILLPKRFFIDAPIRLFRTYLLQDEYEDSWKDILKRFLSYLLLYIFSPREVDEDKYFLSHPPAIVYGTHFTFWISFGALLPILLHSKYIDFFHHVLQKCCLGGAWDGFMHLTAPLGAGGPILFSALFFTAWALVCNVLPSFTHEVSESCPDILEPAKGALRSTYLKLSDRLCCVPGRHSLILGEEESGKPKKLPEAKEAGQPKHEHDFERGEPAESDSIPSTPEPSFLLAPK